MSAPKLRFKEFDGDWSNITLGDYSVTITSGSRDWAQYYSDSGDKFIRMTNLVRDGVNLDLSDLKFVKLPDDSNEGKRTNLKSGDILISITAELGKLGWIPEGLGTAYINQHTALVRMKNICDSKFIAYGLSTEKYNNKLNSLNDSGAKAGLNLGTIRNFELIIPSKEEQTKIASFFSAVDEKINQLSQKLHLLNQYKQGMMQKLFSQQIRFKADDGSEFGQWEKTKLAELLIKHEEKTDHNNQYPVLTSSRNGIFFQKDYFAGQDVASSDTTGYNVVPFGYFTYRHMSDDLIFKFNINKLCEKGIVSTLYPVFTVKETHLNKYFLQIILNEGKEFRNFAIMQKQGGSRTYMYYSKLKELILNIPTLPEQNKIANFLSTIDQKIEVTAQQIEQAKQWKKGLLQQMFV